ncbi:MAG: hypothetical protein ACJAXG_001051 [Celeribacter sp.]|jgi:hypothetical protein
MQHQSLPCVALCPIRKKRGFALGLGHDIFSGGTVLKCLDTFRIHQNWACLLRAQMAEHWDVVQLMPEPDYDPMRPSTENLSRFRELFKIPNINLR